MIEWIIQGKNLPSNESLDILNNNHNIILVTVLVRCHVHIMDYTLFFYVTY